MEFIQYFADKIFMVDPEAGAPSKKPLMRNGTSHQAQRNADARTALKQSQEVPLWKPKTIEDMAPVDSHVNDGIHTERLAAAIGILGLIAFFTMKDVEVK